MRMRSLSAPISALAMAKGLAHADDLVRRQRARAHAALVAAAVHLRFDAHARLAPHVQRADALGAVGLVRGQAHQVDRQRAPGRSSTLPVACAASTWKMMPRSRHIAPMAAMSWITPISLLTNITETRMVSGRSAAFSAVEVEQAVFLHVEVGHLEALALQLAHRVQHRLVLGLHRDEVLAARLVEVRRALQRQVVRLGGARGPDDLARVGADQRGHLPRAPSRPPLRPPSPRRGCATPGCRSARAARAPSRRPRAGRTGVVAP